MDYKIIFIIFVMAVATFPSRFIPLFFIRKLSISPRLNEALKIMPFCILLSMVSINIVESGTIGWKKVMAVLMVFLFSWLTKNIGLSVIF